MLLKVYRQRKPCIRLMRVGQTESGRTWIFTFTDPIHKFMQSCVVAKDLKNPAEVMEAFWEKLWVEWGERVRLL